MRELNISIQNLGAYTKDNVPVIVGGSLFYRIQDPEKALFQIQDLENGVDAVGTSAVRSLLGNHTYDHITQSRAELNTALMTAIGATTDKWGVACTKFEIQTFKPANADVQRQLELQMEAERHRRKQLLDTEARVNVAEGEKKAVIFASEGELQASKNKAEGQMILAQREADASAYRIRMEAGALQEQLDNFAYSFSYSHGDKQPEERHFQLAASYLIENSRMRYLKAIADGQNRVYFLGPNGGGNFVEQSKIFTDTLRSKHEMDTQSKIH